MGKGINSLTGGQAYTDAKVAQDTAGLKADGEEKTTLPCLGRLLMKHENPKNHNPPLPTCPDMYQNIQAPYLADLPSVAAMNHRGLPGRRSRCKR